MQNVLRRIIILGEGQESIDQLTSIRNYAKHNDIMPNFKNGFGENGQRVDLEDFSLKKYRKQAADQIEKSVISYVLEKTYWNRSKACKILKVSYKTLLTKIQELELKPPYEYV